MGKNLKLEQDHIPFYQADHRVWNLGVDAGAIRLWVCSPMPPLQLGAGHRWSWGIGGRKAEAPGPTWEHTCPLLSPACLTFLLGAVPALLPPLPCGPSVTPARLSPPQHKAPHPAPFLEECSHAPHPPPVSGQAGAAVCCGGLRLPRRKEPSMSSLETTKPKMPRGPHWTRWTLAFPRKNWSGPRVLATS